jgi:small conductance mechanosensitive channel
VVDAVNVPSQAVVEPVIAEQLIAEQLIAEPGIVEATEETVTQLIHGDVSGLTQYAMLHLGPSLLAAGVGLLVVFLGYLFARYVSELISRPICRRVDETLGRFVGRMIFYCVVFGVSASVLSKLGAPLGGLAAMLAAAGFAVGLAFQGTLSNFAAGVLMLVFRPFKVGDFINVNGITGKVSEIDLFTTAIDTTDNRRIIVPNSAISGNTIENVTYHQHRRVEVLVGVEYRADIDRTRAALEAAASSFPADTIQGENRGLAVVLSNLGTSSVDWKVRLWVRSSEYWRMHELLTAEVKRQLDAAKIGIPFPQLDVHVRRDDEAEGTLQPTRMRPARRGMLSPPQFDSPRMTG